MNEALTDLANAGVRYNLTPRNKVFMSSFYLQETRWLYDLERPTTKNAKITIATWIALLVRSRNINRIYW